MESVLFLKMSYNPEKSSHIKTEKGKRERERKVVAMSTTKLKILKDIFMSLESQKKTNFSLPGS